VRSGSALSPTRPLKVLGPEDPGQDGGEKDVAADVEGLAEVEGTKSAVEYVISARSLASTAAGGCHAGRVYSSSGQQARWGGRGRRPVVEGSEGPSALGFSLLPFPSPAFILSSLLLWFACLRRLTNLSPSLSGNMPSLGHLNAPLKAPRRNLLHLSSRTGAGKNAVQSVNTQITTSKAVNLLSCMLSK